MKKKNEKIIKFNEKNLNNRTYLKNSISKDQIKSLNNKSNNGKLLGELGHSTGDALFNNLIDKASHKIDNIKIKEDYLVADIEILNTESGKILSKHLDKFVFRPRLIGNVDENANVSIDQILTFDAILKSNDSFKDIIK